MFAGDRREASSVKALARANDGELRLPRHTGSEDGDCYSCGSN
jgi:hypothetical protein